MTAAAFGKRSPEDALRSLEEIYHDVCGALDLVEQKVALKRLKLKQLRESLKKRKRELEASAKNESLRRELKFKVDALQSAIKLEMEILDELEYEGSALVLEKESLKSKLDLEETEKKVRKLNEFARGLMSSMPPNLRSQGVGGRIQGKIQHSLDILEREEKRVLDKEKKSFNLAQRISRISEADLSDATPESLEELISWSGQLDGIISDATKNLKEVIVGLDADIEKLEGVIETWKVRETDAESRSDLKNSDLASSRKQQCQADLLGLMHNRANTVIELEKMERSSRELEAFRKRVETSRKALGEFTKENSQDNS